MKKLMAKHLYLKHLLQIIKSLLSPCKTMFGGNAKGDWELPGSSL